MDLTDDHKAAVIGPETPLLIVDVDEVLGLFMRGFGRFLEARGYEFRIDRFALFQNIYRQGAAAHADLDTGHELFDEFFRTGCEDIEPTPGAAESLNGLSKIANIVILTNAPVFCREGRGAWLARHGMNYPLICNLGPKGEAVAALSARTRAPAAFVDDLLQNLESAAEHAPLVNRFQLVADPRLRPLAPTAPDRHRRIDDWPNLASALTEVLRGPLR